jgi:hypothetical protein
VEVEVKVYVEVDVDVEVEVEVGVEVRPGSEITPVFSSFDNICDNIVNILSWSLSLSIGTDIILPLRPPEK